MKCLHKSYATKGFTLLELAIVMAIIGVIVSGGLVVLTAATQTAQVNTTVAKMEVIDRAMLDYASNFGKLPCPSDLTIIPTVANYGVAAATPGTCFSGTPSANFQSTTGTVEGGVPTRALQLSDDYMYDGWGRRIRYAVDPNKTSSSSLPVGSGSCLSTKAITVKDATGTARTTNAAYVLISHGADGHGGYSTNGTIFNSGGTNNDQLTNCHCTAAGVPAAPYTPSYVQKLPTLNASNTLDAFDDIVSFKEGWQLQSATFPLSSTSCGGYVYVVDDYNNRVQKFSDTGTFISIIGNNTYLNNPVSAVRDNSGNIVIPNPNGGVLDAYNDAGTHLGQYGSSGTGQGQFTNPNFIAMDSSGNYIITDAGTHRIVKLDSTATFLLSIGGSASACTACGCTSGCTAHTTGNANGDIASPSAIVIDSSNNIWMADQANNRVQKYDASGNFLMTLGGLTSACTIGASCNCTSSCTGHSSSSSAGQMNTPQGLALDASGNIWVADYQNNRVEEFSSAGVYLGVITFVWGSADGQTNGIQAMQFDSGGNLWIADVNNNRVQQFSLSGSGTVTATFIRAIGTGYQGAGGTVGATGSANGQFNAPYGFFLNATR